MAAPVQEKRFLINVKRPWKLWLWPFLAILYFAWVLFLELGDYRVPGVTMNQWVLGGLGLFAFVLLVELLLLIPRKGPRKEKKRKRRKAKAEAAAPAAAEASEGGSGFARPGGSAEAIAPTPAPEPESEPQGDDGDTFTPPPPEETEQPPVAAGPRGPDVEIRAPEERVKGRQVIELSLPPKSRNEGSLYAKAYVPVGDDLVVRVETLSASPEDFQ